MVSFRLSHLLGVASLLTIPLVSSSPLPLIESNAAELFVRDTAERYTFTNCVNNVTSKAYAAIFYYYPDYLPDFPEPQAIAYVNNKTSVQFAGKKTTVKTPFKLSATIPSNATKAAVGTVVSTDATADSFAGPMAVVKGSGLAFYSPATNVNCFEMYWQRDNQAINP